MQFQHRISRPIQNQQPEIWFCSQYQNKIAIKAKPDLFIIFVSFLGLYINLVISTRTGVFIRMSTSTKRDFSTNANAWA